MSDQLAFTFEETAFRKHHAENPEIWELFERFAMEQIRAGAKKLGAKAVWERCRWEAFINKKGRKWKFDNNFTAAYARLFMAKHPEFGKVFETRRAKADVEGVAV